MFSLLKKKNTPYEPDLKAEEQKINCHFSNIAYTQTENFNS